jgi:hypothetical protein
MKHPSKKTPGVMTKSSRARVGRVIAGRYGMTKPAEQKQVGKGYTIEYYRRKIHPFKRMPSKPEFCQRCHHRKWDGPHL